MLEAKPQSSLTAAITIALVTLVLASCKVIPIDYPIDKPFVFETNIKLEGNFTKEEKDALTTQLRNQLDDSMRAKTVYKLIYKGINRPVLIKTPVFDSTSADKSVLYMRALLRKFGYLRNTVTYDDTVIVKGESTRPQLRTTVN